MSLVAGCGRSDKATESSSVGGAQAGKTASTAPTDQARAQASIVVSGEGLDLYHVMDKSGKKSLGFTRTGKGLSMPAGSYVVVINNTRKAVTLSPGQPTELACGSIMVTGTGKDLFEVYDEAGTNKLGFKRTGGEMELFAGPYMVKLNNSSRRVAVKPGEKTVLEAGSLVVPGDGKALYEVYDEAGKNKLGFTGTGKPMELLPGAYTVICNQKKRPVVVEAKQQISVEPK
jgi:hypothetical protein